MNVTTAVGAELHAGAATAPLPAESGMRMDGYVERQGVALGVHDQPQVTVVALQQGGATLVIAALDVVALDRDFATQVASLVGVAPESLLIAASHTHSGPGGFSAKCAPSGTPIDEALRNRVMAVVVRTACAALAALRPARLGLERWEAPGVAGNRNSPEREVDDRVTTLSVDGEDGEPVATIVHFACHPTVLGPDNLQISADFPGPLRQLIARQTSDTEAPVLFLNGAAADVSTRFTRHGQTFEELERLAGVLTDARPLEMAPSAVVRSPPLAVSGAAVQLAFKASADRAVAEEQLAAYERELQAAIDEEFGTRRQLITKVQGARAEVERAEGRAVGATAVTLTAARLGDLALLAISAEVSSGIGAAIEAHSPFPVTLVVGYAGDYCGYITDAADYERQTYESLISPYEANAGDGLVRSAVTLLDRLASDGTRPHSIGEAGDQP
jgi:neutral ceramidase